MSFRTTYRTALWQKLAKGKPSLFPIILILANRCKRKKQIQKIDPSPSLSPSLDIQIKHKAQTSSI